MPATGSANILSKRGGLQTLSTSHRLELSLYLYVNILILRPLKTLIPKAQYRYRRYGFHSIQHIHLRVFVTNLSPSLKTFDDIYSSYSLLFIELYIPSTNPNPSPAPSYQAPKAPAIATTTRNPEYKKTTDLRFCCTYTALISRMVPLISSETSSPAQIAISAKSRPALRCGRLLRGD